MTLQMELKSTQNPFVLPHFLLSSADMSSMPEADLSPSSLLQVRLLPSYYSTPGLH